MNILVSQSLRRSLVLALLAMVLIAVILPAIGQPTAPQETDTAAQSLAGNPFGVPEFLEDNFIPALAILSVFGIPPVAILLLALLVFRYREKQQRLYNERLQRFLEAGQPIPEELLKNEVKESTPTQHLNRGMTWLGLGIGLGIFLGLMVGWKVASLALVPIGIAIARLVSWRVASRAEQD